MREPGCPDGREWHSTGWVGIAPTVPSTALIGT
jgi:hypothetical protein